MTQLHPQEITNDRTSRRIEIIWDDGHRSEYGWAGLREACPCAECAGGDEHMGRPPNPAVFFRVWPAVLRHELLSVELTGNYALNPRWGDGHHSGLYTWAFLRGLCPCSECYPEGRQPS